MDSLNVSWETFFHTGYCYMCHPRDLPWLYSPVFIRLWPHPMVWYVPYFVIIAIKLFCGNFKCISFLYNALHEVTVVFKQTWVPLKLPFQVSCTQFSNRSIVWHFDWFVSQRQFHTAMPFLKFRISLHRPQELFVLLWHFFLFFIVAFRKVWAILLNQQLFYFHHWETINCMVQHFRTFCSVAFFLNGSTHHPTQCSLHSVWSILLAIYDVPWLHCLWIVGSN